MHINRLRAMPFLAVVCTLLMTTSCGSNSTDPFNPEVTSATDNFQLQATGLTSTTLTRTYTWTNTGTRATVNHSTTTSAGTAHLTIRDAAGATVYDKALVPSLNEPTTIGASGSWRIELRLTNYSGTVNFRVQKQ
jgi:hypothetical protein